MKLKTLLLVLVSCGVLFGGTGCRIFGKSKAKKKEDAAIAASVESDFKTRWTERRVAELKAQGLTPEAASAQAQMEFRDKYAYLKEQGK